MFGSYFLTLTYKIENFFLDVLHPSTFTHTYNYQITVPECGQDEDDTFQYKSQTKNVIRLILSFCKTGPNYAQFRDKYIPSMCKPLIQKKKKISVVSQS